MKLIYKIAFNAVGDDLANLKMDPAVQRRHRYSTASVDNGVRHYSSRRKKERTSNEEPKVTANGEIPTATATENEESEAAGIPYGILSIRNYSVS